MASKKSANPRTPTGKRATRTPATKAAATKEAPPKKVIGADGRAIYAVSPLRGMAVDAWVTRYAKGWQGDVVRRAMQIVERAAPQATVAIKWRMPVYEENGPFLFLRLAKAHVTVGFWRGGELRSRLKGFEAAERMGHVKIHSLEELDEKGLASTVKDAVRLNRAKGSPAATRR
jgi:hypothetical protein